MGYVFYENKLDHGIMLSEIVFQKDSFVIEDEDEFYDDDNEWMDYYTISDKYYEEIIENICNDFSPYSLTLFDEDIIEIYNSIDNANLKKIFLYIISIVNQFDNIRGCRLVNILCGENVEYKRDVYSRGP